MTRVVFKVDDRDYGLSRASNAADTLRQALAQPEQEPVAWIDERPLYYAPPKREWVGLTDEEKQEIVKQKVHWTGIASAIEAKLKEKNT